MVVLWGGAVSYERGTPVLPTTIQSPPFSNRIPPPPLGLGVSYERSIPVFGLTNTECGRLPAAELTIFSKVDDILPRAQWWRREGSLTK